MLAQPTEVQFDGLVGPTHNYAGLSPGNLASARNRGQTARPRAAALQGLAKMRCVMSLGVAQAVLPPHERPHLATLRRWGFSGSDEQMIAAAAAHEGGHLLRLCSSASAMWTANAATVAPSCDTVDGRVHLVVANLASMVHRGIEAETTTRVLRAIFSDPARFVVHGPLPGSPLMADEGAANHTRLFTSRGSAHVLAWGRSGAEREPQLAPGSLAAAARQTREGSEAAARLLGIDPGRTCFPRQSAAGIDAGGFHTDVLAVGSGGLLLLHELAFQEPAALLRQLEALLGPELRAVLATEGELPARTAIDAYPFNSQLLMLPDGSIAIVAPIECRDEPHCRAFFDRVLAGDNPAARVAYLDVRESMQNGGGPACLRLRVPLAVDEQAALSGETLLDEPRVSALEGWVGRHYRESLAPDDLADPLLHREAMAALDELTRLLALGTIYDFQR
jgi:succinylarginine dihydrolase